MKSSRKDQFRRNRHTKPAGIYVQLEPRQMLASFVVNSLADDGGGAALTLREAVAQAALNSEADTITFASSLAGGTITLSQTQNYLPAVPELPLVGTGLIINQDTITIDGATAPGLAISGNNQYRIFGITGTGNLTLRNITLEDGYVKGGNGGRGNNFAGSGGGGLGAGGAIFVSEGGAVTIVRSTINDNQAIGGSGGQIDTSYSPGGHQKWGAGGGGLQGSGSDSKSNDQNGLYGGGPNQTVLTESEMKGSQYNPDQFQGLIGAGAAGGPTGDALNGLFGGGALSWAIGWAVSEFYTHFKMPDPTTIGGVVSIGGDSDFYTANFLTPVTSTIQYGGGGNGGFGGGGGGAGLDTDNYALRGGNGGFGGGGGGGGVNSKGGPNRGGTAGFGGSDWAGGGAGLGGAIFNNGGTVTISNSTFYGNQATAGYGYGYEDSLGNMQSNGGHGYGGAVFNRNGSLTIVNSTLAENAASDAGTAVYVLQDGDLEGNGNGTGSSKAYASAMIYNSILWSTNSGHTDFEQSSYFYGDGMNGGAGNLIGSQKNFFGGVVSSANPNLSALGNNGGPTETCTFGSSSPAWQSANVAAAMQAGLKGDQRGGSRFTNSGLLDIGAVQNSTTAAAGTTITSLLADRGNQNPSDKSSPLTFYASVVTRDGNRTPVTTGSVTFSYNGSVVGSAPLNASGVATFTTSDLDGVYGTASLLTATYGSGSTASSDQLPVYVNHYTVTNTADSGAGSLRQAIADSLADMGPDYISFAPSLAGQTINLLAASQNLFNLGPVAIAVYEDKVTIDGATAPGLILSGQNQSRLFVVQYEGNLTLKNLTVSGGYAKGGDGGAGLNHGAGGGGGLGAGGAIFVTSGTLNVTGSTFTQNNVYGGNGGGHLGTGIEDQSGAGGGVAGKGDDGNVNWWGEGQAANGGGPNGGIADTKGSGQPTQPGYGGGAAGDASVECGVAQDGNWGGGGGGQTGSDCDGGTGGFGGGGAGRYRNSNGNPGGSYFGGGAGGNPSSKDNGGGGGGGGAGMGGAIFVNYGTVNITNSTFTGNSASGGTSGGNGGVNGSGLGGAIFNLNGKLNINSSTFSGNSADDGRQVYVLADLGSGWTIDTSDQQSGQASATLNNSIFGGADTASTDVYLKAINGGTATSSGGSNLIRRNVGFTGGITSTADPQLQTLTNNGGPTNTMRPLTNLAAVSNTLYLTSPINNLSNAYWYNENVFGVADGFTASFVYQDVGGKGADGIALVLQWGASSPLGSSGGGLGYAGISNSAAYAINVYSPNTVGSGLFTGGKIGTYKSTGNVNFASGNPIQVTLNFQSDDSSTYAGTMTETLKDLSTGATFTRTYQNVNLYSALGNHPSAYLGFTGGTGGVYSDQRISNFSFKTANSVFNVSGFNTSQWIGVTSTPSSPVVFAGNSSLAAGLATDQRGYSRTVGGLIDIGAFQSYSSPPSSQMMGTSPTSAPVGPQLPSLAVRQVSAIYQLILGRRPNTQELNDAIKLVGAGGNGGAGGVGGNGGNGGVGGNGGNGGVGGNGGNGGAGLEKLALSLRQSPEHRTQQVNEYFLRHLKRPATATESNYYVGKILGGASLLSVRTEILKTSGYFGMHHDATDLVQSLYVETLARAANAKERQKLGKHAGVGGNGGNGGAVGNGGNGGVGGNGGNEGAGASQKNSWKVVDKVLGLNEYRQGIVDEIFATFAFHEPTKKERNVAVAKLKQDSRFDDKLVAQLAAKSAQRT